MHCVGCGKNDTYLCPSCLIMIPDPQDNLPADTFARFDYRHPYIKKLVWLLKYHGKMSIAQEFGALLHELFLAVYAEENEIRKLGKIIVAPIPLSAKRERFRGFNQAVLLAKGIANADTAMVYALGGHVLKKIKDTDRQALIKDKKKRLHNLRGCFKVNDEKMVKGKNIIIVDDVTTTGATIAEARRVLKNAGARKIFALTVAH